MADYNSTPPSTSRKIWGVAIAVALALALVWLVTAVLDNDDEVVVDTPVVTAPVVDLEDEAAEAGAEVREEANEAAAEIEETVDEVDANVTIGTEEGE